MTNRNSNSINVPEAREAMDKFKMEAASEVGVDLKQGYNGNLTSRPGFFGRAFFFVYNSFYIRSQIRHE